MDDWRKHKKNCGKTKASKQLPGTAQDPFWASPQVPEHMSAPLRAAAAGGGSVHITSIGFGTPHPSRPHSPALQRQVSLINSDKYADYFLFDDLDRPIRFAIDVEDKWTKLTFRFLRTSAMFGPDRQGIQAIIEYLIKCMGQRPGLSREGILAQFNREYGDDTAAMVAEYERKTRLIGYAQEGTFVDQMNKGMVNLPEMMERMGL
jgi:hypothetical protein